MDFLAKEMLDIESAYHQDPNNLVLRRKYLECIQKYREAHKNRANMAWEKYRAQYMPKPNILIPVLK